MPLHDGPELELEQTLGSDAWDVQLSRSLLGTETQSVHYITVQYSDTGNVVER